jgi:L,D-transpeptidase ErfK/SrfK
LKRYVLLMSCLLMVIGSALAADNWTEPADAYKPVTYHNPNPLIQPEQFARAHALNRANDYARSLCQSPLYKCMPIPSGVSWYKLWPNYHTRQIIMRLNRTNVSLGYRDWLVVPRDMKNLNYMKYAPFPQQIKPPHEREIIINLKKFAFAAYGPGGALVYWGPAAGGKKWCKKLHRTCVSAAGTFRLKRIKGPDCVSNKYPLKSNGGAPMPWCMHYYRGFAIHGSTLMGFVNMSRGCIRLFYDDAMWLNTQFAKVGTKVIVKR